MLIFFGLIKKNAAHIQNKTELKREAITKEKSGKFLEAEVEAEER